MSYHYHLTPIRAGVVQVAKGWAQGAFQTLVGGTASVIGGSKFGNGAVSAAMTWLFNDLADYQLRQHEGPFNYADAISDKNEMESIRNGTHTQYLQDKKNLGAVATNVATVVVMMSGSGEVYYVVRGTAISIRASVPIIRVTASRFAQLARSAAVYSKNVAQKAYQVTKMYVMDPKTITYVGETVVPALDGYYGGSSPGPNAGSLVSGVETTTGIKIIPEPFRP